MWAQRRAWFCCQLCDCIGCDTQGIAVLKCFLLNSPAISPHCGEHRRSLHARIRTTDHALRPTPCRSAQRLTKRALAPSRHL